MNENIHQISHYVHHSNSIQSSLFSTPNIVHNNVCFAYDVLKKERAENRTRTGPYVSVNLHEKEKRMTAHEMTRLNQDGNREG